MLRIGEMSFLNSLMPSFSRYYWPKTINHDAGDWGKGNLQAFVTSGLVKLEDGIIKADLPVELRTSLYPIQSGESYNPVLQTHINLQLKFPKPMWHHGTLRHIGFTLQDLHPDTEGESKFKEFGDEGFVRVHKPKAGTEPTADAEDILLQAIAETALSLENGIVNTGLLGGLQVSADPLDDFTKNKLNVCLVVPATLDREKIFERISKRLASVRTPTHGWFDYNEFDRIWQEIKARGEQLRIVA